MVEGVEFDFFDYLILVYYVLIIVEVFFNFSWYDGICYGYCSKNVIDFLLIYQQFCIEGFGIEVKCCIMFGIFVFSVGYYDVYYIKV